MSGTSRVQGLLPAFAGAALLAACLGLLAARPDPGLPSGVAIAMPGAPQILPADGIDQNEFALVNWAVSGVAIAFAETSRVGRQSRLSLVATPRAAHRIYNEFSAALGDLGFATPDTEMHDVDLTGFTLTRDGARLVVEATWRPLALSESEAHTHLPGRDFAGRFTLERGPAQWRVSGFDLLSADN